MTLKQGDPLALTLVALREKRRNCLNFSFRQAKKFIIIALLSFIINHRRSQVNQTMKKLPIEMQFGNFMFVQNF